MRAGTLPTPNSDAADERSDAWFHNMESVLGAGVAEATNQLDYDDEVGHRAVRKLRDLARSSDERPWDIERSRRLPAARQDAGTAGVARDAVRAGL